ncbi:MAG: hypothetical protein ACI9GW_001638 [Halieaceae bacterium]|jgi:hypothetical protein
MKRENALDIESDVEDSFDDYDEDLGKESELYRVLPVTQKSPLELRREIERRIERRRLQDDLGLYNIDL